MSLLYDSRTLHLSYVHFNKHDPVPAVVREICSAVTHDLTLDRVRESAMETGDRPHEYACVPSFLSFLGARERAERPGVTVGTSCPHLACRPLSSPPCHCTPVSRSLNTRAPNHFSPPRAPLCFFRSGAMGSNTGFGLGFTLVCSLAALYYFRRTSLSVFPNPRRPSFLLVVPP